MKKAAKQFHMKPICGFISRWRREKSAGECCVGMMGRFSQFGRRGSASAELTFIASDEYGRRGCCGPSDSSWLAVDCLFCSGIPVSIKIAREAELPSDFEFVDCEIVYCTSTV